MDKILDEKHVDTKRGFHYRYFASSPSQIKAPKYTLLLCHGFPDGAMLWQFVVPHLLASGLRLVVPDLLGYGGTDKPTDPKEFAWPGMVADVWEILQKEGVRGDVIPVGHDWGSSFAQRFYMLDASKCAGLITLNVALSPPRAEFDLDAFNATMEKLVGYPSYAYWKVMLPESGAELMEQHLESLWYAMHADVPAWIKQILCVHGALKEFLEADRQDVPLKSYAQRDKPLFQTWLREKREGGIKSPTCWYRALAYGHQAETERKIDGKVEKPYLFIGCNDDWVCRTDLIERPKGLGLCPDLTVRELESGHWCAYEKPQEVAETIVAWLGGKGFLEV